MSIPFVGEGHRKLVDDLTAEFDRVCAERTPSWWALEANTGWGKTRVIQEFYGRLAAMQPNPPYWPPSIVPANAEELGAERKRVHPELGVPPAGMSPTWFWWGISCSMRHGVALNALEHDLERFDERREAIERRFGELTPRRARLGGAFSQRKGEVTEAAIGDAVSAAASAASLAIPVVGLLLLLGKWGVGHATAEHRRRVGENLGVENRPNTSLVDVLAPQLVQFASAGIPLLIAIEDVHAADDALIEMVARVLAARAAPIFVLTTSQRGMLDETERRVSRLLSRVEDERLRRVFCEREIADLSPDDLAQIVDASLPGIDSVSRERLASRFVNPYALQLACKAGVVARSVKSGSVSANIIASLPRDIDSLFRHLWEELPKPLQRALVVASQLTPGSVSDKLGFDDLRWDPELVAAAVESVGWLAEDLPELATSLHAARDSYAWIRTVDEWLQRFHDPAQYEIAASAVPFEYGPEETLELRRAAGRVATARPNDKPAASGERVVNRDRLLVALASEGLIPWSEPPANAASKVCTHLLELGGAAELDLAAEICRRALDHSDFGVEARFELQGLRAACLAVSGRVLEAIAQFECLLDEQIRILGADAPATLRTRNNLAGWLGESGRVTEAVDLFQQLLDGQTRRFGSDARETLIARSNLARYVAESGRVEEAIERYRALLKDFARVLGRDARDTLTVRSSLAYFVGQAGRVREAIELHKSLLDDQTQFLGPDAPDTLTTRRNLAHLLSEAGRLVDAAHEYRALLEDERRVLGPDSPATLATRGALADLVGHTGDVGAALEQLRELLQEQTRVLGTEAPGTLTTRGRIVAWTGEAGRIEEAIEESRQLLDDKCRVLGPDARGTLVARSNLASWLAQIGRLDEAESELGEVLQMQLQTLGADHPDVLANRNNLAEWLAQSGRVTEAAAKFEWLVDAQTRVLGRDAPATLLTRSNLAYCVAMSGRVHDAIAQFQRLLEDHGRLLGQDEKASFLPHANLAHWLVAAGRPRDAIEQYQSLVDAQTRVLGSDASDTRRTRDLLARLRAQHA